VARRILGEDVTQIEHYTERVKRMVGKVLTGNGITRYERGTYDLVPPRVSSSTDLQPPGSGLGGTDRR